MIKIIPYLKNFRTCEHNPQIERNEREKILINFSE
jgi:hypothetical protein